LQVPAPSEETVDIEALLLASLGLAAREPRLRTVAVDWALQNSRLISITRLRSLLEDRFAGVAVTVTDLAERLVGEGGDARWRVFVSSGTDATQRSTARPGSVKRRAVTPRWRGDETLMLQLRRGLGVGVKADVLAILLGALSAWLDIATLSALSFYTVPAVRVAADDLANAGLIEGSGGHRRAFRANLSAWQVLLPRLQRPVWRRRADGYAFTLHWLAKATTDSGGQPSSLALAVAFSVLMREYWPLWLEVGVTQEPVSDDRAAPWDSRHAAVLSLVNWFGGGE
jgi:hypothetical protein